MSLLFLSEFTKIYSPNGAVLIVCIIFVRRGVTPSVFPFERKPCNGLVVLRWARWAWKEKKIAFCCFICRASVMDEWMSIGHWYSDIRENRSTRRESSPSSTLCTQIPPTGDWPREGKKHTGEEFYKLQIT